MFIILLFNLNSLKLKLYSNVQIYPMWKTFFALNVTFLPSRLLYRYISNGDFNLSTLGNPKFKALNP